MGRRRVGMAWVEAPWGGSVAPPRAMTLRFPPGRRCATDFVDSEGSQLPLGFRALEHLPDRHGRDRVRPDLQRVAGDLGVLGQDLGALLDARAVLDRAGLARGERRGDALGV